MRFKASSQLAHGHSTCGELPKNKKKNILPTQFSSGQLSPTRRHYPPSPSTIFPWKSLPSDFKTGSTCPRACSSTLRTTWICSWRQGKGSLDIPVLGRRDHTPTFRETHTHGRTGAVKREATRVAAAVSTLRALSRVMNQGLGGGFIWHSWSRGVRISRWGGKGSGSTSLSSEPISTSCFFLVCSEGKSHVSSAISEQEWRPLFRCVFTPQTSAAGLCRETRDHSFSDDLVCLVCTSALNRTKKKMFMFTKKRIYKCAITHF